jgi:hypothetical protein
MDTCSQVWKETLEVDLCVEAPPKIVVNVHDYDKTYVPSLGGKAKEGDFLGWVHLPPPHRPGWICFFFLPLF